MIPVVITVGGMALTTWTEMTLQRSKDEMTGSLNVTIFAGAMQSGPMVAMAKAGADISVYIGGQLAFCGTVDKREGSGTKKGSKGADESNKKTGKGKDASKASSSVSIGPNEYTIKLSARGKTKRLIDSSHQHPTTNMMRPTTKEVVEKLVQPWQVQVEWKGKIIKLDKVRFRDGARVVDELHRVALENCYFMYETRDGKLRVTDGVGTDSGAGEPLILGQNILKFSAEQSEDKAKSEVKVKGQRTKKEIWGRKALKDTHTTVRNAKVKSKNLLTVQHYGDATKEELERRARFEMNKRNSASQKITIDVFHVQSKSGAPWDVGNCHYVEVPPEGIFDMFECTALTYHVDAEKEIKTTLTLSPPPSGGAGGAGGGMGGMGGFGLSMLNMGIGLARRSQANIPIVEGQYPDPWTPPVLSVLPLISLVEAAAKPPTPAEKEEQEKLRQTPPLTLPPWFGEETS
jgi:prophage tail gpP-like protein